MTTTTNQHTWIGKDIKRHEDPALLMGTAIYTNDVNLPGMLHAAVLRSPYAHARIVSIDTSAAKKLPGVYAVLTGHEATEVIGPLPAFCAEPVVESQLPGGVQGDHRQRVVLRHAAVLHHLGRFEVEVPVSAVHGCFSARGARPPGRPNRPAAPLSRG